MMPYVKHCRAICDNCDNVVTQIVITERFVSFEVLCVPCYCNECAMKQEINKTQEEDGI
jgi:hypothetical protein